MEWGKRLQLLTMVKESLVASARGLLAPSAASAIFGASAVAFTPRLFCPQDLVGFSPLFQSSNLLSFELTMALAQFAAVALVSAYAGRTAVRQDSSGLYRLRSAERASPRPLSQLLALRGGGSAPFSAALFDFDGTLVDSEDVHRLSFSEVLGITLDEDYWNTQCVGHSPRDIMTKHLPEGRLQPGESVDTLLRQRGELFEEHIAAGKLEQIEGAAELVTSLVAAGVRCAVVSSGNRGYIEKALEALNLTASFEFILAGDDAECTQHKPHPFPYLFAAEKLGVPPAQCLAFEDSLSGIRSAQAHSMRT